jgi:hypothetical protein
MHEPVLNHDGKTEHQTAPVAEIEREQMAHETSPETVENSEKKTTTDGDQGLTFLAAHSDN